MSKLTVKLKRPGSTTSEANSPVTQEPSGESGLADGESALSDEELLVNLTGVYEDEEPTAAPVS